MLTMSEKAAGKAKELFEEKGLDGRAYRGIAAAIPSFGRWRRDLPMLRD